MDCFCDKKLYHLHDVKRLFKIQNYLNYGVLWESASGSMECKICNEKESFKNYHYKNASMYDDSLTICPKCNNKSVDIEVSDIIQISEVKHLIKDNNFIDLTFITYEVDDYIYIISKGEK